MIAANGGSDLICLPGPDRPALARRIVQALTAEDYVGAMFVDDALGPIPGTLPLQPIGMKGSARDAHAGDRGRLPQLHHRLRHGPNCAWSRWPTPTCSRARASTAPSAGPTPTTSWPRSGRTSKRGFVDPAPVSNADIAVTLASSLKLPLAAKGSLTGRVISEALAGGPDAPAATRRVVRSAPAADGFVTQLDLTDAAGKTYADEAGSPARAFGLRAPSPSDRLQALGDGVEDLGRHPQ